MHFSCKKLLEKYCIFHWEYNKCLPVFVFLKACSIQCHLFCRQGSKSTPAVYTVIDQVLLIRKTAGHHSGAKKLNLKQNLKCSEAKWVRGLFYLTFFYSPPPACFCYRFLLWDNPQLHNQQPAEVDHQQLHSVTSPSLLHPPASNMSVS